jgi:hypothetical protein
MFGVVKNIFNVFKSAGTLFKGLGAVGKVAGKVAGKGIMTAAGKVAAKKIPGIGAILGVLFGISRFRKGDILGGIGEIVSGIAAILPGPGTAISLLIDGLLIMRDINKAKAKAKETKTKVAQSPAEAAANLSKMTPMQRMLKYVPGIGLIMGISRSITRFKAGDTMGGFLELVSGINSTFPGPGTAISMVVDALINFRDIKKMKKAKGEKFNFFTALWDSINSVLLGIPKLLLKAAKWYLSSVVKSIRWLATKSIQGVLKFVTIMMKAGTWALNTIKAIPGFIQSTWDSIKSISTTIVQTVEAIPTFIQNTWDNVKSIFTKTLDGIKRMFTAEFWIDVAKGLWSSMKSGTSNVWSNMKSGASNLWSDAKEVAAPISGFASNQYNQFKSDIAPARQANDYIGAAKEVVTASGQKVQLSPGDIATVKKGQPSINSTAKQVSDEIDMNDDDSSGAYGHSKFSMEKIRNAKTREEKERLMYNETIRQIKSKQSRGEPLSSTEEFLSRKGEMVSKTYSEDVSKAAIQNDVTSHLNNSAAQIKASREVRGQIAKSAAENNTNTNNIVHNITKINSNVSSSGHSQGQKKLPLWKDIDSILAGNNI